ncbi:MAG: hypothetical protein AAB584_01345 [Patescibacteria group bacterium]
MRTAIHHRVENNKPGLYVYLLFPMATAFLITFIISRMISYFWPWLYLPILPDVRVHHFAYGFFVLAASGYLALIFDNARAKYFISLLHGLGLGLALDEFGMWLRLRDDEPVRWGYDGFLIFFGVIFLIVSAKPGIKMLKIFWPFKKTKKLT